MPYAVYIAAVGVAAGAGYLYKLYQDEKQETLKSEAEKISTETGLETAKSKNYNRIAQYLVVGAVVISLGYFITKK